jgi:hypothetical protein
MLVSTLLASAAFARVKRKQSLVVFSVWYLVFMCSSYLTAQNPATILMLGLLVAGCCGSGYACRAAQAGEQR